MPRPPNRSKAGQNLQRSQRESFLKQIHIAWYTTDHVSLLSKDDRSVAQSTHILGDESLSTGGDVLMQHARSSIRVYGQSGGKPEPQAHVDSEGLPSVIAKVGVKMIASQVIDLPWPARQILPPAHRDVFHVRIKPRTGRSGKRPRGGARTPRSRCHSRCRSLGSIKPTRP
jgi:hypothetical protein